MKIGKAFGRYCEKDPQNGNNFETGWKFQKTFKIHRFTIVPSMLIQMSRQSATVCGRNRETRARFAR